MPGMENASLCERLPGMETALRFSQLKVIFKAFPSSGNRRFEN